MLSLSYKMVSLSWQRSDSKKGGLWSSNSVIKFIIPQVEWGGCLTTMWVKGREGWQIWHVWFQLPEDDTVCTALSPACLAPGDSSRQPWMHWKENILDPCGAATKCCTLFFFLVTSIFCCCGEDEKGEGGRGKCFLVQAPSRSLIQSPAVGMMRPKQTVVCTEAA